MMKYVFIGFLILVPACSVQEIDCVEIALNRLVKKHGVCSVSGIVEAYFEGAATYVRTENGLLMGVSLTDFPNIKPGDRVFVKARYWKDEQYLSLEDYLEIRLESEIHPLTSPNE